MDLDELRRLTREATPEPWIWATDAGAPLYVQLYSAAEIDEYEADVLSADGSDVLVNELNASLIAAARNALPDLLAVVDAAADLRLAISEYFVPADPAEHFVDPLAVFDAALAKLDGAA